MYEGYRADYYVVLNAEENHNFHSLKARRADVQVKYKDAAPKRSGAVLQHTVLNGGTDTFLNTGTDPCSKNTVSVEYLSAAYIDGIGSEAKAKFTRHRFVLHFAYSAWQGEAQWRHEYAEDVGLYRTYNHDTHDNFRICSQGTWSTRRYEPVLFIEDTALNKCWYIQIMCGHGWSIEAGITGQGDDTALYLTATDCDFQNDGWHYELQRGEKLSTCEALTGCVDGGFEAAVADLTEANRALFRTKLPARVPPVCFNDYMNCLWALPTKDKTLPLIDAAADVGAEYYVIDAGWYSAGGNELADLGTWDVNDRLFGSGGLKSIAERIRQRGMLPGIWLELESAGYLSRPIQTIEGSALTRFGRPLGNERQLIDFRRPEVREYMRGVIDRLYQLGFRYIKNDYNANTGAGIDPDGAQSVREHSRAFEKFIDSVLRAYPDLIIENCGSGAMRSDMSTLSHFHLQSVSDQEDYFRLPSIIAGSLVTIPPERCGVWVYPYPAPIWTRETFKPSAAFKKKFADGRVTAYNMVNGLMGLMYLSGHIDCADEYNKSLIREGVALFKKYRRYMPYAVPVYPTGTFDIDDTGVNTLGLLDRTHGVLTIAVWNNSEDVVNTALDLSRYTGSDASIRLIDIYPEFKSYDAALNGDSLVVTLPCGKTALFAALRFSNSSGTQAKIKSARSDAL